MTIKFSAGIHSITFRRFARRSRKRNTRTNSDMTLASPALFDNVNELLAKAYHDRVSDLEMSLKLATQALSISRMSDEKTLIAKSLTHLALFYMILGEHEKSRKISEEAIAYYQELKDEKGVADARYNLAGIYYKTNNFHLGLLLLLDCLVTYEKFEDHHSCSKVEKSLGTIYEYFHDDVNAIKSYELGIESAKRAGDLNLESNCYNPLSGMLLKQGNAVEAMRMILQSIEFKKQTGDERGLAFAYYGRGKVNMHLRKFEAAEKDYLKSLDIHFSKGERLGVGMAYNKLGILYTTIGATDKAKEILAKGIHFCNEFDISLFYSKCCHQLSEIHFAEESYKEAYYYLDLYQKEREAMLDAQMKRVIDNYESISKLKTMELEAQSQKEKAEITEKKNRAEEAARIKSEFLSTMSHEIRTPLNGVISISNMLSDRADESEQRLLESLRYSGNTLMRIVNDILDFTKLEAGKMRIEPHKIQLVSCIEKIGTTYSTLAENKQIELVVLVDEKISDYYELDDIRLSQVLGNLLSNAIKFTDYGKVQLSAEVIEQHEEADIIHFSVADTGSGISQKNLEDIFETFAQPRSVATRKQGGTGLGLAVVRRIVQLFGSEIYVKSEIDIGSTFHFDILAKRCVKEQLPTPQNLSTLKGKKVLLAEDNIINSIVATKLLTDWGLVVDHVLNGQLAVMKANQNSYDYILMDIHMPEMSGYEATQLIRENPGLNQNTTIYALTADISADQDEQFAGKFEGFLNKPIDISILQNALVNRVIR